jgi:hypothetical protein
MLDDIIGTYGERLVIAVIGLGIAFAVLIVALWFMRRRGGPAPFLKGGRNRQPRLQVLDATAVDARRRLVLVRRDNVEHLIMIGGPTDIVVESGIGAIPFVTDITGAQQQSIEKHAVPTSVLDTPLAAPQLKEPSPAISPAEAEAAPLKVAPPILPEKHIALATPKAPQPKPKQVAPTVTEPRLTATVAKEEPTQAPILSAEKRLTPQTEPSAPAQTPALARPSHSPVQTSAMRAGAPSAAPIPAPAPAPASASSAAPAVAATTATLATQPVAAAIFDREPVSISATQQSVTTQQVDDFFSAARGRVLPDLAPNETLQGAEAKPQQISIDDSFSAELRDDFESFLNAEIEKNAGDHFDVSVDSNTPRAAQKPPITGAIPQNDTQKEMARIFGEMSVKRDD